METTFPYLVNRYMNDHSIKSLAYTVSFSVMANANELQEWRTYFNLARYAVNTYNSLHATTFPASSTSSNIDARRIDSSTTDHATRIICSEIITLNDSHCVSIIQLHLTVQLPYPQNPELY
jgi:hypothetical protein